MIRQYFAHRRRGGCNPLGVGVIPVGAIFFIQDDGWWRDRYRGAPICRDPWIVEAFLTELSLPPTETLTTAAGRTSPWPVGRIRPSSDRCATAAAARSPFVSSSSTRTWAYGGTRRPIRTSPTRPAGPHLLDLSAQPEDRWACPPTVKTPGRWRRPHRQRYLFNPRTGSIARRLTLLASNADKKSFSPQDCPT